MLTKEQIDLLWQKLCAEMKQQIPELDFRLFIEKCNTLHLDPFADQIYMTKRGDKFVTEANVDGLRAIAERSGQYGGRVGLWWCGPDGVWKDVWLEESPPAAAKVAILRKGATAPTVGIATLRERGQRNRDGGLQMNWGRMPAHMLAKVAEADALRAAFPDHLGRLYTREEMGEPDSSGRTPDWFDHQTQRMMAPPRTADVKAPDAKVPEAKTPEARTADTTRRIADTVTAGPVDPTKARRIEVQTRYEQLFKTGDPATFQGNFDFYQTEVEEECKALSETQAAVLRSAARYYWLVGLLRKCKDDGDFGEVAELIKETDLSSKSKTELLAMRQQMQDATAAVTA